MLVNPMAASAGTMIARRARLGIVWMIVAVPSTGCSSHRRLVTSTPAGMLKAIPAQQRKQRQLEVRGQIARQEGELLAHAGLSSRSRSTIRAWRVGVSISWRT